MLRRIALLSVLASCLLLTACTVQASPTGAQRPTSTCLATYWKTEATGSYTDNGGDSFTVRLFGLRDVNTNVYCGQVYTYQTFYEASYQCRLAYGASLFIGSTYPWNDYPVYFPGCGNTEYLQSGFYSATRGVIVEPADSIANMQDYEPFAWTAG